MDYDAICLPSGKKLSVLRVQDLKKELMKRRLSTIGKKADLSQRLAESLLDGGDEAMETEEVDETLPMEPQSERFITPDRENTHPEEDPSHRKSTKASRVRPPFQPVVEESMEADPFLSEDDEPVSKPPASVGRSARRGASVSRSRTHTVSPAKPPASERRSTRRQESNSRSRTHTVSPAENETPAADHRRISAVAMRTRSRSPQATTPGNMMAGATTPQRPATGKRTPKSAAVLFGEGDPRTGPARSITSASRMAPRSRRALLQDEKEVPKQPLSHKPPRSTGRLANRFAAHHKKLDEAEESLHERQLRILERHEKMTNGLPDVVKRLNTPKQSSSRLPIRAQNEANEGFKFEPLTEQPSLKFGFVKPADISQVQKEMPQKPSTSVTRSTISQQQKKVEKMDVKARTKTARAAKPKLTVPDDDSFVDYIATPKGKTPLKTPSRVGYTPKKGHLNKFVDTTKLTDRELQLAREEGLIGGSTAKTLPRGIQNSRKRTDEIIAIRRKLNL